jgi:polygalacturonase
MSTIIDFGAVNDGITHCGPVFQKGVTALAGTGLPFYVPAGHYAYRRSWYSGVHDLQR